MYPDTPHGHERSDVDLLVSLSDPSAARVAELTARLERRLGREVQLVRLQDAESTPLLMVGALERGRVLVDRDGQWPDMRTGLGAWERRAAKTELPLLDAMESLGTATAGQVHEAARIVADEFAPFYDAYRDWIGRGFSGEAPG